LQHAFLESLEVHRGLVGIYLGDHVAPGNDVPGLLQPFRYRPLLHRVGEPRHKYFGQLSPYLVYALSSRVRRTARAKSLVAGMAAVSSGLEYGSGTSAAATRSTGASK